MWTNYSTRDAADLVGLAESAIRGCARAGLLSAGAAAVPLRFSFQDVAVLKKVKELVAAGVSLRRVRRELGELRLRLPDASALSSLSLAAHDGHVVVREGAGQWRADTGQLVFAFSLVAASVDPAGGTITAMPVRREAPAPEPVAGLTADDWFDRATELEEGDSAGAIEAYARCLKLRPDSGEALINLGRLFAENGVADRAAECFTRAIELDPRDATAVYNLGVVAQDLGKDGDAVRLYERALELDGGLAEAHYNLATLFDRGGDTRAAIRHINEYRKLTRD